MRFDSYHPAINLLFFAPAIGFALWFSHPAFLAVAYVVSFAYSVKLNGFGALALNVALVPLALAYGAWFAMTEHFGVTVLGVNSIGNCVTLEALAYGIMWGLSVATAVMWTSCVFVIFTTEKVTYLLGRVSPSLSLAFSVVLRAVPVVVDRARRIGIARSCIGRGVRQGDLIRRVTNCVQQASILVSWSIERFLQTSESMRSRGSLLRGRTAYSIYRFDNRDRTLVIALVLLLTITLAAASLDQCHILYDPVIVMNRITPLSFAFYAAYAVFCALPLALQIIGEHRFKGLIRCDTP